MQVKWMPVLSVGGLLLIGPAGDLAWAQASPRFDYFSVIPCRLVDTRLPAQGPALASGAARSVTVTGGSCGIPAIARAVTLNVTSVAPTGGGNLKLYPGDGTVPPTSALNFTAGQTRANNGAFSLAGNGNGTLAILATVTGSGTVHVVLDVTGYFVSPEERLRQAVTAKVEAGVCIPQGNVSSGSISFDYCNTAACPGGAIGCPLTPQMTSLDIVAGGLGQATVDVVLDISGTVPLSGTIAFQPFSCDMNVLALQQHRQSQVVYQGDTGTGNYTVTSDTPTISPTFVWQLSNCGYLSSLGNLVNGLLNSFSAAFLQSLSLVGLVF